MKIPNKKTKVAKIFTITGRFYEKQIVKYLNFTNSELYTVDFLSQL